MACADIAVMYLSLRPQFIDPERGNVLLHSLTLGATQRVVSVIVSALVVLAAGSIASFLVARPTWAAVQRWIMGTVFAGFAGRMVSGARR